MIEEDRLILNENKKPNQVFHVPHLSVEILNVLVTPTSILLSNVILKESTKKLETLKIVRDNTFFLNLCMKDLTKVKIS